MKNALKKSAYREIRSTKSRFLSIFGIVAIGVGFFSGVKAAAPDMRLSADAYYDKTGLMDFRLVSTYGFDENDIAALGEISGAQVTPSYYTDLLAAPEGGSPVAARVFSLPNGELSVNRLTLTDGRFPQSPNECVTAGTGMKDPIKTGAVVTFTDGDGNEPSDMLERNTYTVVGTVLTPMCIDKTTYGSTSVGNGSISSVFFVPEENFCVEYNTEVYLRFPELDSLTAYNAEYDERIEEIKEQVEEIAGRRETERFDEIMEEADEKLDDARKELADAEKEANDKIADGEKELSDAKIELEDAERELADGEKKLADGEKELSDARKEIDSGYEELAKGKKEYAEKIADAQRELSDAAAEIAENEKKLSDGEKEYADGLSLYEENFRFFEDGRKQLADGKKEYEDGLRKYEDGKKQLADGKKEYEDGLKTYEDGLAQYEEGKKEYESGLDEYWSGKSRFDAGKAQYQSGLAQYEAGLSEFNAQKHTFEAAKSGYEAGKAQYDAGAAQLEQSKALLDGALLQLEQLKAAVGEENPVYIAAKSEYDGNYAEYAAAAAQLGAVKEQLDAAKAQLDQGEAELNAAQAVLDKTKSQLDDAKIELDLSENQLRTAKDKLDEGKKTLDETRAQLDEAKAELDVGKKEIEENEAKLAEAEKELADAKKTIDETELELAEAEKELADAKKTLDDARAELDDGARQLADGKKKYEDGLAELEQSKIDAEKEFSDAEKELADAEREYSDGLAELADARRELSDGRADYEQGLIDYADGEKELADGKAEADEKISDAKREIDDAQKEIDELEPPEWYVFTRDDNAGYAEYGENADRINNIASVFPVFFILVAALVCLTTMTRMVDEQRVQIGTLKALGYPNGKIIYKYMLYAATATASGAVFGVLAGMQLFPIVIVSAYGIMYALPELRTPVDIATAVASTAVSLAAITATVFFACRTALSEQSAQLMRPKAPKMGKRIFLEKIGFVWKRFNFSSKVTARNIFRYKRKMFMSVVGIAGCTALLMTGFALYDSINDVILKQYGDIQSYDGIAVYDGDKYPGADAALEKIIAEHGKSVNVYQKQMDVTAGGRTVSAYIAVPQHSEDFTSFLHLRNRLTGEEYRLNDGTVYMDEKLTLLIGAVPGDSVEISKSDTEKVSVTLTAAFENYPGHYVYMTENTYAELFGEKPEYNALYFAHGLDESEEDALAERMLGQDGVLAVSFSSDVKSTYKTMLDTLGSVIIVIIVSAGLLAFIVMYNLTNINIEERIREIATLKVLGFYDREVDAYIFRENILLTLLGTAVGLVLGIFLARFVITTAEVDFVMFGRTIYPMSYILAALFTLLFSVLVTLVMHRRLKNVDMIEALKSVE